MRDLVFISYSHNDKAIFAEFKKNLDPGESRDLLDVWEDTRIEPGTKWAPQIRKALDSARVALLLVSSDYLDSKFIRDEELRLVLARAERQALSLYWVPVRASLSENAGLKQWQAAPGCNPERPLDRMKRPEREQVIVDVCRKILDKMGPLPSISRDDRKALKDRVAKIVGPDYQVLEEIGTGSSSIVYKAVGSHGPRVIKTLAAPRSEPSGQDDLNRRADLAQQLTHPAYIRLYERFLDHDPCCVVTEYVDCISLDRYREWFRGPIAPRRVQQILVALAEALAEAHGRDYLHEGLVPSNIHIDRITGRPRISAFRFLNVGQSTDLWGTFLTSHEHCTYLSPEQFDGCNRSAASDQHALGLLGYELLSGQPIERVTRPADFVHRPELFARLQQSGPWAERAPALAGVVLRMLCVDPDDRWPSMAQAARILEDVNVEDSPHEKARRRVKGSYSTFQAIDRAHRLYESFYASLFASLPEARQLFAHTDMPRQHKAINDALNLLLDCDTDLPHTAEAAAEKICSVARKHQQYGLGDREIDAFEAALLQALASCGESEPETLKAWRTILERGFHHMRDALCTQGPIRTAPDAPAKGMLGDRPGATATPAADARSASSDAP